MLFFHSALMSVLSGPMSVLNIPIVDAYAKRYREGVNSMMERVCSQNTDISEILGEVPFRGKRVRTIVMALTADLIGFQGEAAITSAAFAIELIHAASLIHDDVIDTSNSRRGRRTINAEWDNRRAILVGDYLFSEAFRVMHGLQSIRACQALSASTSTLVQGELRQLIGSFSLELKADQYLQTIKDKTAELFSCGCKIIAILAGEGLHPSQQAQMGKFSEGAPLGSGQDSQCAKVGEGIGMAFQLADDLLDYFSPKSATGKESFLDLKEGKVTLPIIYAMQGATSAQSKKIEEVFRKSCKTNSDLLAIQAIIMDSGAYKRCQQQLSSWCEDVKSHISAIAKSNKGFSQAKVFNSLIDFVISRSF